MESADTRYGSDEGRYIGTGVIAMLNGGAMQIGELAAATGVAAKTIRYYEDEGLMPPARRARNGYRVYEDGDVTRLAFIRNARALDIPVADLREVLAARDRGEPPCLHVKGLLNEKVREIDERLRQLAELRADLSDLIDAARDLPEDDVEMAACVCNLIRTSPPRQPS